jgi:dTMP kinase
MMCSGGSSIVFNKRTAAEALIMSADRAQNLDELVLPKLQAGKYVVSDRSAFSWLANQGYERMLKS